MVQFGSGNFVRDKSVLVAVEKCREMAMGFQGCFANEDGSKECKNRKIVSILLVHGMQSPV